LYLELYYHSCQPIHPSSRIHIIANLIIVTLTMSTNSIIADPETEDLLALILLNFEIICLAFEVMLPDHLTIIIHDHDWRIWDLIASGG
jgi:hypothetical protein